MHRKSRCLMFLMVPFLSFSLGLAMSQWSVTGRYLEKIKLSLVRLANMHRSEQSVEATIPSSITSKQNLESLLTFNHIHVSQRLPGYDSICTPAEDVKAGKPKPSGRFRIYFIGDVGSPCCNDLACTPDAQAILDQGGHLEVSADIKLGKYFGIPFANTGHRWKMTESLMLVEDGQGKIRAIFRNASLKNIPDALKFVSHAQGM